MKKLILKIILTFIIVLILKELFFTIYLRKENSDLVQSYFSNNTSFRHEDIMVLEAPSIRLKAVVKKTEPDFKNLDKYLVYYGNNKYQDGIIIFGHSGMGYGTYFSRIDELENNNILYLYVNSKKIEYEFLRKYFVNKNDVNILKNSKSNTLMLITCKKNSKDERLIIELMLKSAKTLNK